MNYSESIRIGLQENSGDLVRSKNTVPQVNQTLVNIMSSINDHVKVVADIDDPDEQETFNMGEYDQEYVDRLVDMYSDLRYYEEQLEDKDGAKEDKIFKEGDKYVSFLDLEAQYFELLTYMAAEHMLNQQYDVVLKERDKLEEEFEKVHEDLYIYSEYAESLTFDESTKVLSDWQEKVTQQTDYLRPYEQAGIRVVGPYLEQQEYFPETDIEFGCKDIESLGLFFPMQRKIEIKGEEPSLQDQIMFLMEYGTLTDEVATLIHELVHDKQYYPDYDDNKVGEFRDIESLEGQAYILGDHFGYNGGRSFSETILRIFGHHNVNGIYEKKHDVVPEITNGNKEIKLKGVQKRVKTSTLQNIVKFIDLYALGVSVDDISESSFYYEDLENLVSTHTHLLEGIVLGYIQGESTLYNPDEQQLRVGIGNDNDFEILTREQLDSFYELSKMRYQNERRKAQLLMYEIVSELVDSKN